MNQRPPWKLRLMWETDFFFFFKGNYYPLCDSSPLSNGVVKKPGGVLLWRALSWRGTGKSRTQVCKIDRYTTVDCERTASLVWMISQGGLPGGEGAWTLGLRMPGAKNFLVRGHQLPGPFLVPGSS